MVIPGYVDGNFTFTHSTWANISSKRSSQLFYHLEQVVKSEPFKSGIQRRFRNGSAGVPRAALPLPTDLTSGLCLGPRVLRAQGPKGPGSQGRKVARLRRAGC